MGSGIFAAVAHIPLRGTLSSALHPATFKHQKQGQPVDNGNTVNTSKAQK